MTQAEYIAALRSKLREIAEWFRDTQIMDASPIEALIAIEPEGIAKLNAEIAEAKIAHRKLRDSLYAEGEADGYLEGLEFARNLLVAP